MSTNERPAVGAAGGVGTERGGYPAQPHSTPGTPSRQAPAHGRVKGNVWRKQVCGSRHMLRAPQGWAVDCDDLDAAEEAGAKLLLIEDVESGRQYLASLAVIRRHGFQFDRGHGAQVALPLARWHCFGADVKPALQLRLGLEGA